MSAYFYAGVKGTAKNFVMRRAGINSKILSILRCPNGGIAVAMFRRDYEDIINIYALRENGEEDRLVFAAPLKDFLELGVPEIEMEEEANNHALQKSQD